ncbi:MAG: glycosyltransferase family 4 protein [Fibromonadaceae bacterium]|jgi:glycosyltransferase involved in cell wall biosynthesis|nr:glycosyltransferase family 4 protein [Fibromonadaceae bacterium]
MKVILEAQHAVGHPHPRGVGHYSINLIQALLRRKTFDYELAFFDYNREAKNLARAEKNFNQFDVSFKECNELDYRIASRDDNAYNAKIYNEWTNTNGDVYHFMNPITVPLRLNGKMVVTIHDLNFDSHNTHTMPLFELGLSRIKRVQPFVIADSQYTSQQVVEYLKISEKQVAVIYPAHDEVNIYPEKTDVSSIVYGEYLLYIGAWVKNKNIPRIIEAFNCVSMKNKGLKLVLAGKPAWHDTVEINEVINASPFREQIITPGYISAEQKRRLYSNALCFVFPSICEGFGLPVLEAMACGCPVITANNTSLPEVGGEAAIYVDAYNTEQLAHEMERVVNSESFRKEIAGKGLKQSKKFSWDKAAEQVEEVYRRRKVFLC